jgi:hypothetical protein
MNRISNQYVAKRVAQLGALFPRGYPVVFTRIAEREMTDELITDENCESVLERLRERDMRAIFGISTCILSKYSELPSYVNQIRFEDHVIDQVESAYMRYLNDDDPKDPESSRIYLNHLAEMLTVRHPDSRLECPEWDLVFYLVDGRWKCRADEHEDEDD